MAEKQLKIAANVEPSMKAGFSDLARRSGLSESDLLRQILQQVLRGEPPVDPSVAGFKQVTRRVEIRLRKDELDAVTRLAKADARSIPAWIVALVRRVALNAEPFNASELRVVNQALAALGPVGRNLNWVVKYFNRTGNLRTDEIEVQRLAAAVAEARAEVLAMAERAHRRMSEGTDG